MNCRRQPEINPYGIRILRARLDFPSVLRVSITPFHGGASAVRRGEKPKKTHRVFFLTLFALSGFESYEGMAKKLRILGIF